MKEIVIKISDEAYNIINGKTDVANIDLYSELISAVQTGVPLQKGTGTKEIIDVVHKTIYQFFDRDGEYMSDKDKFLLMVNKAICNNLKALESKTGHWIEENINEYSRKVVCSECGCPPPFEHISNGDVYSASGHGEFNKTNYCPNCGAKMESEE